MTRRYAEDTRIPVERSQTDVKAALKRAGATETAVFEAANRSMVAFRLGEFTYRLTVPSKAEARDPDQEERRAWRLLILLVKAKLEAIREGATTVEREFMADMMVGPNETMADRVMPELRSAQIEGRMPKSLLLEGPRS